VRSAHSENRPFSAQDTVRNTPSDMGHFLNGTAVANSLSSTILKAPPKPMPGPQTYDVKEPKKHCYAASFGKASRFPNGNTFQK
jgi:hypothetical protein